MFNDRENVWNLSIGTLNVAIYINGMVLAGMKGIKSWKVEELKSWRVEELNEGTGVNMFILPANREIPRLPFRLALGFGY